MGDWIVKVSGYFLSYCAAAFLACSTHAATWVVGLGESLQSKIEVAADGDVIRIADGAYTEDITLEKGVTIQPVLSPGNVTFTGNWTIQNSSAAILLNGFRINGSVSASNAADLKLNNMRMITGGLSFGSCGWEAHGCSLQQVSSTSCDTRMVDSSAGDVTTSSGNTRLIDCTVGHVTTTGGDTTLRESSAGTVKSTRGDTVIVGSTLSGSLYHYTDTRKCTLFQSTVHQLVYINAVKLWAGYSSLRYAVLNLSEGVMVGCNVFGSNIGENLVQLNSGNLEIRNCVIKNSSGYSGTAHFYKANGVAVKGTSYAKVVNTVFRNLRAGYANQACGVYVESAANAFVSGCIFEGLYSSQNTGGYAVRGPVHMTVEYGVYYNTSYGAATGGVVPTDFNERDPKFVDTVDFELDYGSPCINAGNPASKYNDLDGSRNDMGRWGGHAYQADAWTNNLPVVISAKATPWTAVQGETIQLDVCGVVSGE